MVAVKEAALIVMPITSQHAQAKGQKGGVRDECKDPALSAEMFSSPNKHWAWIYEVLDDIYKEDGVVVIKQLPLRLEFRSNDSSLHVAQSLACDAGAFRVRLNTVHDQSASDEYFSYVAAAASDVQQGLGGRDSLGEEVHQGPRYFAGGLCCRFRVATTFV